MKTLCCLIPSLSPGGMEKVMSELVSYFHFRSGMKVHLILYGRSRDVFFSIPDGVHLHKPVFKYEDHSRPVFTFKTLLFLRQQIKSLNPDAVLSFGEEWNNLVLLSTVGLKYPVFVADRAEPGKKRRMIQEFLRNRLYPYSDGIIVQTAKAKEIYLSKFPKNRVEAIGNPFSEVKINQVPERENIVLSVGRLIETKHYDLLINFFSKINNGNWKLVIVGGNAVKQDGMSRLNKLIKAKKLSDKVTLTGTVSDVSKWYQKSKIFAFTSSSEGFPNVIGEAMQHGLPVIAFDCVAGPSDLIEDGKNGYLIPLFEGELYTEKLKKLMNNENLRKEMGNESINKIQNFSLERIGEMYYEFIFDMQ